MTDFLERLNCRLKRKRSEEPVERHAPPAEECSAEPASEASTVQLRVVSLPAEVVPRAEAWRGGDIGEIFGPGGPVAGLLGEGYRPRPGQVRRPKLDISRYR